MYTDSHAHITCDDLYTRIDEVIQNMNELSHCMIMCTNIEEFKRALKLKKRDSRFKVAFGWFPGDAKEIDSSKLEQLKDIAFSNQIDCLGEIDWTTIGILPLMIFKRNFLFVKLRLPIAQSFPFLFTCVNQPKIVWIYLDNTQRQKSSSIVSVEPKKR